MSLLEILQLVGYSTAAALHLWLSAILLSRWRSLGRVETLLFALAIMVGAWHASSLLVALHSMLGLGASNWETLLRAGDTIAVVSVTLTYSLLLHLHLHLWAAARRRVLTYTERARVYLSYIPALFLLYAVPSIWSGNYEPMLERLSNLVLPFALWAAYVLMLVAMTDLLIAREAAKPSERRLMLTLGFSFLIIAALITGVYAAGVGEGSTSGEYLKTLANLGSLLPTALLAYYIYRYRYLELVLKESLIIASFASLVLVVYLYGIRTFSASLTARHGLREGALESILILLLALLAAPLRRWLDVRFRKLFAKETALFRDVVERIGASAGRFRQLPELLRFVAERAENELGVRRVRFSLLPSNPSLTSGEGFERLNVEDGSASGGEDSPSKREEAKVGALTWSGHTNSPNPEIALGPDVITELLNASRGTGWGPLEQESRLMENGFNLAFPLRREERVVGLMLVDSTPGALTFDARNMLELLATHVAIAVDDCRLVEENVLLDRQVAESERLAELGRMAATVAHEVRNPLSAIKSIAQVMGEDEKVRLAYERDLRLIVGEADRLSRSVTQMLDFARRGPQKESPLGLDELLSGVILLTRNEASQRRIDVVSAYDGIEVELPGETVAPLRDALLNLLTNALEASPRGGSVSVKASVADSQIKVSIADEGCGVQKEQRERIWEPFYTTKQRGTGLGLSIVRRRIEEVGGRVELSESAPGEGACFELSLPLKS